MTLVPSGVAGQARPSEPVRRSLYNFHAYHREYIIFILWECGFKKYEYSSKGLGSAISGNMEDMISNHFICTLLLE